MIQYKEFEKIKEQLLYKTIVEWTETKILLDDGTVVEIVESEQDCCATAGGTWKNVKLDAVITDIRIENLKHYEEDDGMSEDVVDVIVYHNQNEIAQATCSANDGNGGYYYSVCSLRVKDVHYPVVEC